MKTIVLLLALASTQAIAHDGDFSFSIPYVSPDQLTIDGDLSDWKELFSEPTATRLDFNMHWHAEPSGEFNPPDKYDPANLDFRSWVTWSDDGKVYVAIEATDDVYRNSDGIADQVALIVDGDHSGYHGDPLDESYDQYYDVIIYPDWGGLRLPFVGAYWDEDGYWAVEPPYALGTASVLEGETASWTVEFCVTAFDHLLDSDPDGSETSKFEPGHTIGFTVGVFDFDHDDVGSGQFYLEDVAAASGFDRKAHGVLTGSPSAVESTTWGRIKATLRP